MNRLLFRAYDKKEKKWLFGYEMPNLGGFSLLGETVLLDEFARVAGQYVFGKNGHSIKDLEIMQYTGLKDKNRKEIYEGDILAWNGGIGDGHEYQVTWVDKLGGFYLIMTEKESKGGYQSHIDCDEGNCLECEIIGNIYENPELLNTSKAERQSEDE